MGTFPNKETQFKPGQSGNPGGSSTAQSLTRRVRALLEKDELGGVPLKDGKTVADLVAEVFLKGALKGDFRFVQELLVRIDGKVTDRMDITTLGREVSPEILDQAGRELAEWRRKMKAELLALTNTDEDPEPAPVPAPPPRGPGTPSNGTNA